MTHPSPFNLAERTTCRICGGTDLHRYLDLGDQPPANSFILPEAAEGERSFPLRIVLCGDCGLSQLLDIVSSEDIFDESSEIEDIALHLLVGYWDRLPGTLTACVNNLVVVQSEPGIYAGRARAEWEDTQGQSAVGCHRTTRPGFATSLIGNLKFSG